MDGIIKQLNTHTVKCLSLMQVYSEQKKKKWSNKILKKRMYNLKWKRAPGSLMVESELLLKKQTGENVTQEESQTPSQP